MRIPRWININTMFWFFVCTVIIVLCTVSIVHGETVGQRIDDVHADQQAWQEQHQWEYQEILAAIEKLNVSMYSDVGALERVVLIEESIGDGIATSEQLSAINARITSLHDTEPPIVVPPASTSRIHKGVGLGFVGRSNGTHPDDPNEDGYVELITPVASVIRFMNPNYIAIVTNSAVNSIDDRINIRHLPDETTWRVQLAWQVALCNDVDADFYLNTPFYATANWTREAVAFIRVNLNIDHSIYIAWCNEPWNGVADPYQEIKKITGHGMGGGDDLVFFDEWARRIDIVFNAARESDPTCIRVFETQTANVWVTGKVHDRITSDYECIAGTAYWSPRQEALFSGITKDQVFDAAWDSWNNDERHDQTTTVAFALAHEKRAITYEAGPHFVDFSQRPDVVNTLRDCQEDPRMAGQYGLVLDNFFAAGGDLSIHFEWLGWWNKHGYWGFANALSKVATANKYVFYLNYKTE